MDATARSAYLSKPTEDWCFTMVEMIEEEYCFIYQNDHPKHEVETCIEDFWTKISFISGLTVETCKTRWATIRYNYKRLKRLIHRNRNRLGEEYYPQWDLWAHLNFLQYCEELDGSTNHSELKNEAEEIMCEVDQDAWTCDIKAEMIDTSAVDSSGGERASTSRLTADGKIKRKRGRPRKNFSKETPGKQSVFNVANNDDSNIEDETPVLTRLAKKQRSLRKSKMAVPGKKQSAEQDWVFTMLRIIQEDYPYVYDAKHEKYNKNKEAVEYVWEVIAFFSSVTVEDVKIRWRSIRDNFTRIKRFMSDSLRKGKMPENPEWSLWTHLEFMDYHYGRQYLSYFEICRSQGLSIYENYDASEDEGSSYGKKGNKHGKGRSPGRKVNWSAIRKKINEMNSTGSKREDWILTMVKLIEEDHPYIYQTDHPKYKNKDCQNSFWQLVQFYSEISADKCKTRWQSLRDQYVKNKRMQEEKERETSKPFVPVWSMWQPLQFLFGYSRAGENSVGSRTVSTGGAGSRGVPTKRYGAEDWCITMLKIIQEDAPYVYQRSHPKYQNNDCLDMLWITISFFAGVPEENVKKRWRSLRDSFTKMKGKIENREKMGGPPFAPDWILWPHMQFMAPYYGNQNFKIPDDYIPPIRDDISYEHFGKSAMDDSLTDENAPSWRNATMGDSEYETGAQSDANDGWSCPARSTRKSFKKSPVKRKRVLRVSFNSGSRSRIEDSDEEDNDDEEEEEPESEVDYSCRDRVVRISARMHACGECPGYFKSRRLLDDHKEMAHRFVCFQCGDYYNMRSKEEFMAHFQQVHKGNIIVVPESNPGVIAHPIVQAVISDEPSYTEYTVRDQGYDLDVPVEEVCIPYEPGQGDEAANLELMQKAYDTTTKLPVKLKCNVCGANFDRPRSLELHITVRHGLTSTDDLQKFMEDSTNVVWNDRGCHQCKRLFYNRRSLGAHMKLIHNLEIDDYGEKGVVYSVAGSVVRRINGKVRNETPVVCDICGVNVPRFRLKQHKTRHLDSAAHFKCKLCEKGFPYKGSLNYHVKSAHGEGRICTECGKVLKNDLLLKFHIDCYHSDRCKLKCKEDGCDQTFNTEKTLRNHIRRVHLKVKNHQCMYCDKAFFDKRRFEEHTNLHTREKIWECDLCGRQFNQGRQLRSHKRTKHGIYLAKSKQQLQVMYENKQLYRHL